MAETIYAAFSDSGRAESAAGALLDHGVPAGDISLVMSDDAKRARNTPHDPELAYTQPMLLQSDPGGLGSGPDALGDSARAGASSLNFGGSFGARHETMESDLSPDQSDLNPAQNDYPRSDSASPTEFSSRPPAARYDFNPELDKRNYNADYEGGEDRVDAENRQEFARDQTRTDPANLAKEGDEGLDVNRPATSTAGSTDAHEADRTVGPASYDPEVAAKRGVTTTTIHDAARGAAKGVGLGLGVGALAAIAAIAVPGVGLVLGGGALATAIVGIAASAGAGAVAGGVVGYLKDQGVAAEDIPKYKEAYDAGGAILSVTLNSPISRAEIEGVLTKYGAQTVNQYGYVA